MVGKKHILFIISGLMLFGQLIGTSGSSKDNEIADKNKFVKIYKDILLPKCSSAGCHDGSFEPDFRTLESSYNTLIYHTVIKNTRENSFNYRVIPFDTAGSILYERVTNCCLVDQADRMPFSDKAGLNKKELKLISDWIMQGAPDIFGRIPEKICTPPAISRFELYGIDSIGKNHLITKTISNHLGEAISMAVEAGYVGIQISVTGLQDKYICDKDSMSGYIIGLYNDINYKSPISAIKCFVDTKSVVFEARFLIQSLPKEKPIFFRLENTHLKNFSFPHEDILEQYRYKWAFTIKKTGD